MKNVEHSIPRCDGLVREREVLMKMAEVTAGFKERGDEEVTQVLDAGCRYLKAGKVIECMWRKRFCVLE